MKRARTKKFFIKSLIMVLVLPSIIMPFTMPAARSIDFGQDVNISFSFAPTISLTISDGDLMIKNLAPGNSADSNAVTLSVSTNNETGYLLTATVGDSTDYNTTDLVRATTPSDDTPAAFTSVAFGSALETLTSDNTWGFSSSVDGGTTWQGYSGLPLYSDATNVASLQYKTTPPEDTDNIEFKIAARAGFSQIAGTYQNIINFSLVANAPPLVNLERAFAASGATKVAVGNNSYYAMQDMTPAICAATEVIDEDSQLQLVDTRDDSIYWVTKLADGHCWMTQNLDLFLESDTTSPNYVALTSENTDLNQYGANGYDSAKGYSCTNPANPSATLTASCTGEGEVIAWLPERSTIAAGDLSETTWDYAVFDPYSYDPGANNAVDTDMNAAGAGAHGLTGNYYNWTAAIASNDSEVFDDGTSDDVADNPKNSVCPKGWRLPTISSASDQTAGSTDEFGRLNVLYNEGRDDTGIAWTRAPLYFPRAGMPHPSDGTIGDAGETGWYWSSTVRSGSSAYFMVIAADDAYSYGDYRDVGMSVRCVAR